MRKIFQRLSPLIALSLLLVVTSVLFHEVLLNGKVPIAFDYGVYTYQPWQLDLKDNFTQAPKAIGHDDIRIFYPQRKFTTDTLKNGEIPFWNPYEFSGNVSMANSQTATFYPPFLLFLCLPQTKAWSILSFSVPVLAGFGFFLFLRQLVKNESAAIFGSLVFAFSSGVITRTEDGLVAGHTLIWLPWVLYGIEVWFKSGKLKDILTTLFSLLLSMLAGWFQFTFYIYALGFVYALFLWVKKEEKKTIKELLFVIGAFTLSLCLTAFHWLPAVEAFKYSPRGVIGAPSDFQTKHLMPLTHLITLIIPDFFGHIANGEYFGASEYKEGVLTIGLIPFLLAATVLLKRQIGKIQKLFIGVLLAAVLLGLKTPIAKLIIALNIPILSTFLPNRILLLASFALVVLAAYGFRDILSAKKHGLYLTSKIAISMFIFLYCAVGVLYIYEKGFAQTLGLSFFEKGIERYVRIIIKESIIPAVFTGLLILILRKSKGKTAKALPVILVGLTIFGQIQSADRYLYFSQAKHEFPQNPVFTFLKEKVKNDYSRFLSISYSRIPSNVPSYYNLYFPEGVDAMYPKWYGEFTGFYNYGGNSQYFSRIESSFSEEFERRGWLDPKNINLLSHLGVRYVIVPRDHYTLPPQPAFEKVFSHGWHTIYEYKYAFPKAYFVPRFSVANKSTLGLIRVFHPEFFDEPEVLLSTDSELNFSAYLSYGKFLISNLDLKEKYLAKRAFVEPDPFANVKHALEEFKKNPVKVVSYTQNRIILSVELKEDGFIVLNDAYFPGWKAEVDGVFQPVLRANHAFRAVPVKKGEHEIIVSYFPKTFLIGLLIAVVSATFIIILAAIAMIRSRIRRKDEQA